MAGELSTPGAAEHGQAAEPSAPPAARRPPAAGLSASALAARGPGRASQAVSRALSFERLKATSFAHSLIYTGLLVCAFAAGKPEPLTFALGMTHGVLWILMSLACLTAARLRVVSLRLAVAVAVLGGIGPFFGSLEFIRESRHRAVEGTRADALRAPR